MIVIKNLTKRFDKTVAIDDISVTIPDGSVMGLVGSNGSGKSTLLRVLSGVYQANKGEMTIDGARLFDNAVAKGQCYFVPDFPFFYNNSTINNMAFLYRGLYPNWDEEKKEKLDQCYAKYGYGSPKCRAELLAACKAEAEEEKLSTEYRAEMKRYPGTLAKMMIPSINPYLFKGRHGPPKNIYSGVMPVLRSRKK